MLMMVLRALIVSIVRDARRIRPACDWPKSKDGSPEQRYTKPFLAKHQYLRFPATGGVTTLTDCLNFFPTLIRAITPTFRLSWSSPDIRDHVDPPTLSLCGPLDTKTVSKLDYQDGRSPQSLRQAKEQCAEGSL